MELKKAQQIHVLCTITNALNTHSNTFAGALCNLQSLLPLAKSATKIDFIQPVSKKKEKINNNSLSLLSMLFLTLYTSLFTSILQITDKMLLSQGFLKHYQNLYVIVMWLSCVYKGA